MFRHVFEDGFYVTENSDLFNEYLVVLNLWWINKKIIQNIF